MKQIIDVKIPDNCVELKSVSDEISLLDNTFLLVSQDSGRKHILKYEKEGFIFRETNQWAVGTNGYWPTIKKAIENNLRYGQIFCFPSIEEAAQYIVSE